MRDPERLSSSNGISQFERELLDAGKNESMPAALREQMERALGLPGASAPGVPVRARVEAATGVKASAMVWISAGVVVLGVVGGIIGSFASARLASRLFSPPAAAPVITPAPPASAAAVETVAPVAAAPAVAALAAREVAPPVSPTRTAPAQRSPSVASPARAHAQTRAHVRSAVPRHGHGVSSVSASSPAPAVAPAEAPTLGVSADESTPAAPSPAVAARDIPKSSSPEPSKGSSAPAPSGDLRAEIDLIDGARAALRAGDTAEALDLLGRHAVHFPHGAFAPEETALRVEALMRRGRTAEARAYARRFIAANPASPLAERMRRLVDGDTAP